MLTFCARAVTLLLLSILLFLIIIIFSNATISVCTSAWLETNATPIQCDLLAQALQSMMHTWLWGMGVSDVYIEEKHTQDYYSRQLPALKVLTPCTCVRQDCSFSPVG